MPLDRHVEGVLGLHDTALGMQFLGCHGTDPGTERQAGRQLCVLAALAAGLAYILIQQILEQGARTLETGGIDIGQVVADDRQTILLGLETGLGNPK